MSKNIAKIFKVICTNKKCESFNIVKEEVLWYREGGIPEAKECENCKEVLTVIIPEKNEVFNIGKFNSLSPNEKQQVLKKRSHEHFKKHVEEKKRDMWKRNC